MDSQRPARLRLWAWSLIACPLLALLAVALAGSDGGALKFVFLFLVLPAVLSGVVARRLPVRGVEAAGAALAAAGISGCLWIALILALASSGVFE
jgi:predicted permease